MGTWGLGAFDNDAAWDLMYELEDQEDLSFITEILREVNREDYLEAPRSEAALAAAEVLAAVKQGDTSHLPENLKEWIDRITADVDHKLISSAVEVVERIKRDSELRSLWEESGNLDKWLEEIQGLEERLKS